jgi:hypothetical protein
MEASGLSKEDQEVLSSGDTTRIYLALAGEEGVSQPAAANAPETQPKPPTVLPSVVPVISASPGQYAKEYAGYAAWQPSQAGYWQHYWYPYWSAMASQPQAGGGTCAAPGAEGEPANTSVADPSVEVAPAQPASKPQRVHKGKKRKESET